MGKILSKLFRPTWEFWWLPYYYNVLLAYTYLECAPPIFLIGGAFFVIRNILRGCSDTPYPQPMRVRTETTAAVPRFRSTVSRSPKPPKSPSSRPGCGHRRRGFPGRCSQTDGPGTSRQPQ